MKENVLALVLGLLLTTFLGDFDPSWQPLRTLRFWSYSVKMKP